MGSLPRARDGPRDPGPIPRSSSGRPPSRTGEREYTPSHHLEAMHVDSWRADTPSSSSRDRRDTPSSSSYDRREPSSSSQYDRRETPSSSQYDRRAAPPTRRDGRDGAYDWRAPMPPSSNYDWRPPSHDRAYDWRAPVSDYGYGPGGRSTPPQYQDGRPRRRDGPEVEAEAEVRRSFSPHPRPTESTQGHVQREPWGGRSYAPDRYDDREEPPQRGGNDRRGPSGKDDRIRGTDRYVPEILPDRFDDREGQPRRRVGGYDPERHRYEDDRTGYGRGDYAPNAYDARDGRGEDTRNRDGRGDFVRGPYDDRGGYPRQGEPYDSRGDRYDSRDDWGYRYQQTERYGSRDSQWRQPNAGRQDARFGGPDSYFGPPSNRVGNEGNWRDQPPIDGDYHRPYNTRSGQPARSAPVFPQQPPVPANERPNARSFGTTSPPPAGKKKNRAPAGDRPRRPSPKSPTFKVTLPAKEYIQWSSEKPTLVDAPVPKLLVLDLNGALVYRVAHGSSGTRKSYPRPFLANFLEYLFTPGSTLDDLGLLPYDVLVWSSAQPHNVRNMVEANFDQRYHWGVWDGTGNGNKRGRGRLLNIWGRDKMGLSEADYGRKVQTVKDLRKVVAAYTDADEKTTVLLDDSPLKAVHQPWSQIIIPEFDRPEFDAARDASARLWRAAAGEPDAALADGSDEEGMDNILLGVIGILEAMRHVPNVPAWVRAGHIHTPFALAENSKADLTLADLPTHESFTPWFKDAAVHAHWVQKGREALARCGITVSHGLLPDGNKAAGRTEEEVARAWNELDMNEKNRNRNRRASPSALVDGTPPPPLYLPHPPAPLPKHKQPKEARPPPQHAKARRRKLEREGVALDQPDGQEEEEEAHDEGAQNASPGQEQEEEREEREYSPSAPVS